MKKQPSFLVKNKKALLSFLSAVVLGVSGYSGYEYAFNKERTIQVRENLSLTLTEKECKDLEILALAITTGLDPRTFKQGKAVYNGKEIKLCYSQVDETTVLVIDETGDGGVVSLQPKKQPL